jgi:hypothetical protein
VNRASDTGLNITADFTSTTSTLRRLHQGLSVLQRWGSVQSVLFNFDDWPPTSRCRSLYYGKRRRWLTPFAPVSGPSANATLMCEIRIWKIGYSLSKFEAHWTLCEDGKLRSGRYANDVPNRLGDSSHCQYGNMGPSGALMGLRCFQIYGMPASHVRLQLFLLCSI